MDIHEAIHGGKPFAHPDMIGAWLMVDGSLVHRDCIADFLAMDWIRENCMPRNNSLHCFYVEDLTRDDWYFVN